MELITQPLSLCDLPKEMIIHIFFYTPHLYKLFTISKRYYKIAYELYVYNLILSDDPRRDIYINMISIKQYENDLQRRIIWNGVMSEITARYDDTEDRLDAWYCDIEDEINSLEYVTYEETSDNEQIS